MNSYRFYFLALTILLLGEGVLCQYRWCCISNAEYNKCWALKRRYPFPFHCILKDGTENCVVAIENNQADLMFLDGGDIYTHQASIDVVAQEDYGQSGASYYAVAVVRKDAPSDIHMLNLYGLKSCHTGVGKTSGWNTPMGWLARKIQQFDQSGHIQLQDPFEASCAPGANSPSYASKLPDPSNKVKWCKLCVGDGSGNHVCDRDNDEQFYGYDGAFRCLQEGVGDVAFVKHTTVPESEQSHFSLLCPDGSRAHPADWRSCNLAKVPAHGLVMRRGTSRDSAHDVYQALKVLKSYVNEFYFAEYYGKDLLWKSSTVDFDGPFVMTAREYLGREYYCNLMTMGGQILPDDCLE